MEQKVDPFVLAQLGLVDRIRTLLEKDKIKLNQDLGWGRTLIHIAAQANQPDLVKYLLHCGAQTQVLNDDGYDPIDQALINFSHEAYSVFKQKGLTKRKPRASRIDTQHATIFDLAQRNNAVQLGKYLKYAKERGAWRRTALHWAAIYGQLSSFNLLLEAGIEQEKDAYGLTAIDFVRLMRYNTIRIDLDLPLNSITEYPQLMQ